MTNKKRASEQTLAELHSELAVVLKKAVGFVDEEGKPNPALLNVARQFLKDNKIEAEAPKGSHLDELAQALPEFEDEMPDTATPTH